MTKRIEDMSKEQLIQEVYRLHSMIHNPSVEEFLQAVRTEAAFQQETRDLDDHHKTPFDWFWTCGYLCQKAAGSAVAGDLEKAKHHTISTAALMYNWFNRLKAT